MNPKDVNNLFGDMDIDLIDQVLKGNFENRNRILELGCGQGRNLIYFFQQASEVYAIDKDPSAIELCRYIATQLDYTELQRLVVSDIQDLPFEDQYFDAIISSRAFHFAESKQVFIQMWQEQYRVLKPGGLLYFSMDSTIGFQKHIKSLPNDKVIFKDGVCRFVLDERLLKELDIEAKFKFKETIKTVHFSTRHAHSIMILEKKHKANS